jgi:hypothetical protein
VQITATLESRAAKLSLLSSQVFQVKYGVGMKLHTRGTR